MLIAAAFFVGVLILFLGAYWLFVVRPEDESDRAVKRRLHIPTTSSDRPSLLNRVVPMSTVPLLQALLQRSSGGVRPLERLIQRAGMTITVGRLVLLTALVGVVALVVVTQLLGDVLFGLVAGLLLAPSPYLFVRYKANRRIAKFEEQFPEAVDLIARSLRAGHALTSALGMAAEETVEPVRGEFKLLYDRQNYGMPLPDAMRDFAERVPLLDARFFVTSVLTQREAGGNLAEVLDSLAALIRERFKLRRQVRTLSAHGRITGWILGVLPFVVGGALFVIAPAHISKLFTDPMGLQIVAGALTLQVIGVLWIRKVVNIEL